MRQCKRVTDLLGAYVYGDLSPEEARVVDSHVSECRSCYEDLEARARAVHMVPNETPKLTDEERMRVMWSVKGAIRSQRKVERTPFFARASVWGFATAAIVAVAFGAGFLYGPKTNPPKAIVKQVPAVEKPMVKPATPPKPEPESVAKETPGPTISQPIITSNDLLVAQPPTRDRPTEIWRGNGERKKPEPEAPKLSPVPPTYGLSPLLGLPKEDDPQTAISPILMSPDGSVSEPAPEAVEPEVPAEDSDEE